MTMELWDSFPKDIDDLKKLIVTKHALRTKVYHAMYWFVVFDPVIHKDLQSSVMSKLCAHHFSVGQAMMSCM
jgi:hypothetical protein